MSYWWIQEGYPHWEEEKACQGREEDKFPRPDQVLKYYRMFGEKAMNQEDLAILLGIKQPEIVLMENGTRKINIERRRALCRILKIPPKVLGVVLIGGGLTLETPQSVDIKEYQERLNRSWELEFKTSAHRVLPDAVRDIYALNLALDYASDRVPLQDLLCNYHALTARILIDQQSPNEALMHQDKAVNYAISLGDSTRIALNLHRKGCLLGDMNYEELACMAYDQAMQYERRLPPNVRFAILSNAALHRAKNHSSPDYQIRSMLGEAYNILRSNPVPDNDHRTDYSLERYGVTAAATMYHLGKNEAAREALAINDEYYVRRGGYASIVETWTYMAEHDYERALWSAEAGLEAVQQVHSLINIARVQKIHDDLRKSPYKDNDGVARLEYMLNRREAIY